MVTKIHVVGGKKYAVKRGGCWYNHLHCSLGIILLLMFLENYMPLLEELQIAPDLEQPLI